MTNQELFSQAIADAKAVRNAAVANAKAALEETFTPKIMSMLSAKLNELEEEGLEEKKMEEKGYSMKETEDEPQIIIPANDADDDTAEYFEEILRDAGIKARVEVTFGEFEIYLTNPTDKRRATKVLNDAGWRLLPNTLGEDHEGKKKMEGESYEEDYSMEETDLEEILAQLEAKEKAEETKKKDMEEAKKKVEEKKDMEKAKNKNKKEKVEESLEEDDDNNEVTELTVDELKDIIRDVLKDVMGDSEEEGEGEIDLEDEAGEEVEDEESISLDELLAELEKEKGGKKPVDEKKKMEKEGKKPVEEKKVEETEKEDMEEAKKKTEKDLEEAITTIKTLQTELNEVNLLNAKLLYTNKIFKAKSLNEAQKVKVLKTFDKATNVKEVKTVYNTLSESLSSKTKSTIKESVGFASKAAGVAPKQPIVEGDAAIRRMQQLAGIIK
jgi:hypothetical protein